MVKHVALAMALAACLSKPNAPVDGGPRSDTMADAPSDTPIDAPDACMGPTAAPFPTTFLPERVARIMDFDRNGSDDVIVFGRVGTQPNVFVRAYVVLGRSPMRLDCYDYEFSISQPGDLLDVWVGDLTGDSVADVALLAKTNTQYLVELYAGRNSGGVEPRVTQVVANDSFGITPNIGGEAGNREPVFIAGFRNVGQAQAGLAFGGSGQPWIVAPFTSPGFDTMKQLGDTGTGGQFSALAPAEQVWAHAWGDKRDLIVATTNGALRVIRHDLTNDIARFILLDGMDVDKPINGAGKNRTVRVWHREYGTDTTIAAMEGAAGNMAIVRYVTDRFTSEHIETPSDFDDNFTIVYDYSFGTLDSGSSEPLDVMALTGTAGAVRRLSVHRNIDFATPGVDGLLPFAGTVETTAISGDTLAVGNFDTNPNTGDQILVLRAPAGGSLGACYEVINQTTTACLAACGTTTCL